MALVDEMFQNLRDYLCGKVGCILFITGADVVDNITQTHERVIVCCGKTFDEYLYKIYVFKLEGSWLYIYICEFFHFMSKFIMRVFLLEYLGKVREC